MAFVNENEDKLRAIAKRIFRVWDKKMNGDISYDEFSKGLHRMRTSIRSNLKKKFWNTISQEDDFVEEEDLVDFLLSEFEDPVLEGFKKMLIGAAQVHSTRRLKSTLDLAAPQMKDQRKSKRRFRCQSVGDFWKNTNLQPVPTRKSRVSRSELVERISISITERDEPAYPTRPSMELVDAPTAPRVRKQSIYGGLAGPTAPTSACSRSKSKTALRIDSDSDEKYREHDYKSQSKRRRPKFTEKKIRERHSFQQSRRRSSTKESLSTTQTSPSYSSPHDHNPYYKSGNALRKKQLAMWHVVINLLQYPRRERRLRGTGKSAVLAELIRSFAPFDDIRILTANFNITDLQYCTFSRSIVAASRDGIFRFNAGLECWMLVYKFRRTSLIDFSPPTFLIDNNGDIYFQFHSTLYFISYKSETADQVKPKGTWSRMFTSIHCTGHLCIDATSRKIYYISNDRVQCLDICSGINTVSTIVKLDNQGVCVSFDNHRKFLYCSDVLGTIYMATKDESFTVMKFENVRRHGIVVDPVSECLLIHNKCYIHLLEPGLTLLRSSLRKVRPTSSSGDMLAFDPMGERVFFVEARSINDRTKIGILKFV